MTGMLSRGLIGVPHAGHADGGDTIESPFGTLYATTLANEPKIRPKAAAIQIMSGGLVGMRWRSPYA